VKRALAFLVAAVAIWPACAGAQTADAPAHDEQPSSGATVASRARDLGRAGLSAYGQADFEAALGHFRAAEALAHSPVFQLYAARSLLRLDRVDEARAELETILTTAPEENAPSAWLRARREAADELLALANVAPEPVPNDQGDDDFDADGRVRRVAEGEVTMPTWHPEPAPRPSAWMRASPNQRGAVVAFGVGALGLVFSAITGGMAIAETAAVKANCIGAVCREEDLPRAVYATQLANLATVGAVVAVTGGATGAVLWVLPDAKGTTRLEVGVAGPALRLAAHF
jgi:tetratricopeptide (TPR) repeat protein